jgi:glycosyltransferase involved in cell wall biosynthesis
MKVPVSILIPIKNEAVNLPRCMDSIKWADEIFVVDSQSEDKSVEIAENYGAKVVQFQFNGTWPKKKNWALENLPFQHEWVFILDADEVLPPGAELEIKNLVTSTHLDIDGYWINRRFMFMGKWLRHAYYPNWNLRLFRHKLGRYEKLTDVDTASGDNEVHEHVFVNGSSNQQMRSEIDHYAFPSIEVFIEKHNRYSNWEARVTLENKFVQSDRPLQNKTVNLRRQIKGFVNKLPCRPLMRFLYVYIWQKGFLDGKEGYYFARLHSIYEFLNISKTAELRKQQSK